MKAAKITINGKALANNIARIKALAPQSKLMAIVKANAYGQGVEFIARDLRNEVDGFGVARVQEGLALREDGVTQKILLLEGFFSEEELKQSLICQLDSVVHCREQLAMLEQVSESMQSFAPIDVWIKIDTGMHRLGIAPEEVDDFYRRLRANRLVKSVNFVSHFSRADELDCGYTEQQIACFEQATQNYQGERSLAASSGILYWPQSHYDWVRSGIIMYGISPHEQPIVDLGFEPVMTFSSSLIAVREHKAGEPVGYGGTWISPKATKLGVIAVGYGDGYPRNAPEGTPVYLNGRIVPIVGRVSMDMITVDLGAESCDRVGDEVILWGKELLIEEVARKIGVINYELITKLLPRVKSEYDAGETM